MDEKTFKALPEDQRKAAQQKLIELNLYNGTADGKWGTGTKAAFDAQGIEIPFPHVTLYAGVDKSGDAPALPLRVSGALKEQGAEPG